MRKKIPLKLQKLIYQEAFSTCPFCCEKDINVLKIHHINGVANGGSDDPENLILTCSNCHDKIHNGIISEYEIKRQKSILQSQKEKIKDIKKNKSNIFSINLNKSNNSGIIANTIKFEKPKKSSVVVAAPEGSIGTNLNFRNYIRHLIDRYINYKKIEMKGDMNFTIVYGSLNRKFGCSKWELIPINKFEEAAFYLQERIDKTRQGKRNKSKGIPNYSTFEEYLNKYVF